MLAKFDNFFAFAEAAQKAEPGILRKIGADVEGRPLFDRLTSAKDSNIDLLHEIERVAPDRVPMIARALLEDILDEAAKQGGFDRAKTIGRRWEQIGSQSKALLFKNPQLVAEMDSFFLLAQKQAERVNPSGTTAIVIDAHWARLCTRRARHGQFNVDRKRGAREASALDRRRQGAYRRFQSRTRKGRGFGTDGESHSKACGRRSETNAGGRTSGRRYHHTHRATGHHRSPTIGNPTAATSHALRSAPGPP